MPHPVFWKYTTDEELEKSVEQRPPTKYRIYKILEYTEISFPKELRAEGLCTFQGVINGQPSYEVQVRSGYDEIEKEALIHELLHVLYRTAGLLYPWLIKGNERIIERETQKFLKNEPDFVERLFRYYRLGEKGFLFQSEIEDFL